MNEELAWAAGFFDGEGSTTVCRVSQTRAYPRVGVGQIDRDVLDRFADAVGVGKVYGPYSSKGGKQIWSYAATSVDTTIEVFSRLWPHLSSIKKQQALRAFAECGSAMRARSNT
jgi:hypothetical protein